MFVAVAMAAGLDSPRLRFACGASFEEVREARDLFVTAMAELGIELPSEVQGIRAMVRYWAAKIVAGVVPPVEAARLISTSWRVGAPRASRGLTPFVGLASQWGDDPRQQAI